ncbi:MAG: polyphosphate polymerase domain-containing protein [Tannerella sp.]|jgi:hypothetical protein|nr:polyphosphate polymerase domain-containing protein [Tannerella sp.]
MNIPINNFATISLDEMTDIRLMDRIDSKFVVPISIMPQLLNAMIPLFRVQTILGKRIARYLTQYFDTPTLDFYLMHQNGKLNRQKIRIRSYTDSDLSFLEIKNKNNRGQTNKKRIPVNISCISSVDELGEGKFFLDKHSRFASDSLVPALRTSFRRMTFVNNRVSERITIDVDLSFRNDRTGNTCSLDNLMILELKQGGRQHSDFREILGNLHIKPCSFSKYCMGIFLTDTSVKSNRFKYKMTVINKLIQ